MMPGKNRGNQIDHYIVSKKREKMIHDVTSYRGASIDSDLIMVVAKINIGGINQTKKQTDRKKWDVKSIKKKKEKYQEEIKKKLTEREESNEIETKWNRIKNATIKATERD